MERQEVDADALAAGVESIPPAAAARFADSVPFADIEAHCRRFGKTDYHPVGARKMGTDDLAVVSTTYGAGEQGSGRVGVIGPMRMDYRRTIKIVEEVGDGLEDSLGV